MTAPRRFTPTRYVAAMFVAAVVASAVQTVNAPDAHAIMCPRLRGCAPGPIRAFPSPTTVCPSPSGNTPDNRGTGPCSTGGPIIVGHCHGGFICQAHRRHVTP